MTFDSPGIHHVTAISSDPQGTLDFYSGVLGMRLLKRTVNFDDPTTHHFYFGDGDGNPGSIITFFPWPGAKRGRQGSGQAAVTSFAILPRSVGFWMERFIRHQIEFEHPKARFDEERVISFRDPDGMLCELVAHPVSESGAGWETDEIPREHSIRGIYGVTLWLDTCEPTASLLVDSLGYEPVREQASIFRFAAKGRGIGSIVDLRSVPGLWEGVIGAGTVHHVAFRALSDDAQMNERSALVEMGLDVTPQIDREYFHSIYFREPGGVLFEIATDSPGFTVDEPLISLGTSLKLPAWLEPRRFEIEALLPNVSVSADIGRRDAWPDSPD